MVCTSCQGIYNCREWQTTTPICAQAITAVYVIYEVGDDLMALGLFQNFKVLLRSILANADRNFQIKYKEKLMGSLAKRQAPKRLEQPSHQKQQCSVLLLCIQRLFGGIVDKNETNSISETRSQSTKK